VSGKDVEFSLDLRTGTFCTFHSCKWTRCIAKQLLVPPKSGFWAPKFDDRFLSLMPKSTLNTSKCQTPSLSLLDQHCSQLTCWTWKRN
jgi:hypothetical protein